MLYRHSLRFKGYWLGFLSWTILTFATPVASAVAETDAGLIMRLCSAHGVQWIEVDSIDQWGANDYCLCLSLGLDLQSNTYQASIDFDDVWTWSNYSYQKTPSRYVTAQPRSPPFSFS